MAALDIANTWGDIRQGVKDAETLIGQKQYNMAMIKSRQVLELMVNYLCDNASVDEEDLASSIDALYEYQWIDKATCEHYHKIRMLGNKAVHEGNDDAYDANQAYHLLSQEVYTFANEYKSKKRTSRLKALCRPLPKRQKFRKQRFFGKKFRRLQEFRFQKPEGTVLLQKQAQTAFPGILRLRRGSYPPGTWRGGHYPDRGFSQSAESLQTGRREGHLGFRSHRNLCSHDGAAHHSPRFH